MVWLDATWYVGGKSSLLFCTVPCSHLYRASADFDQVVQWKCLGVLRWSQSARYVRLQPRCQCSPLDYHKFYHGFCVLDIKFQSANHVEHFSSIQQHSLEAIEHVKFYYTNEQHTLNIVKFIRCVNFKLWNSNTIRDFDQAECRTV
jgi:hypothetical protein